MWATCSSTETLCQDWDAALCKSNRYTNPEKSGSLKVSAEQKTSFINNKQHLSFLSECLNVVIVTYSEQCGFNTLLFPLWAKELREHTIPQMTVNANVHFCFGCLLQSVITNTLKLNYVLYSWWHGGEVVRAVTKKVAGCSLDLPVWSLDVLQVLRFSPTDQRPPSSVCW